MKKVYTLLFSLSFLVSALDAAPQVRNNDNVKIEAKKKSKSSKSSKSKKNKTDKKKSRPQQEKFRESKLAHQLLDGKRGIEIGGSSHNAFGLNTLNVDYTDDSTTVFKQEEKVKFGQPLKVDIVSEGDDLPFKDNVWDFVISSHVIEHFYDPVKTVEEWLRVVKPGGYVYIIAPHKERTFDKDRPRTTLAEIIQNHDFPNPPVPDLHGHYSVWITEDFVEICNHYGWPIVAIQDVDDKVGNGFAVVIQKPVPLTPIEPAEEAPSEEEVVTQDEIVQEEEIIVEEDVIYEEVALVEEILPQEEVEVVVVLEEIIVQEGAVTQEEVVIQEEIVQEETIQEETIQEEIIYEAQATEETVEEESGENTL